MYCARFAAAILSDPSHAISSTETLRSLLQQVLARSPSHPQWTQVDVQVAPDAPFTHATILSMLSQVQSAPLYYVVYIMVVVRGLCSG